MMTDILQWFVAHPFQSVILLFLEYIVIATIYAKGNKVVAMILVIPFIVQDVIVNVVAFSVIGLELPKEYTVTERLKRWKREYPDNLLKKWHFQIASGLCSVLNRFDPGHC